jgi:hypothetical protein
VDAKGLSDDRDGMGYVDGDETTLVLSPHGADVGDRPEGLGVDRLRARGSSEAVGGGEVVEEGLDRREGLGSVLGELRRHD